MLSEAERIWMDKDEFNPNIIMNKIDKLAGGKLVSDSPQEQPPMIRGIIGSAPVEPEDTSTCKYCGVYGGGHGTKCRLKDTSHVCAKCNFSWGYQATAENFCPNCHLPKEVDDGI